MNGINEMQMTHLTDQQIEKTNVPRLLQTIKAIAPRSYEKAFSGMDEQVVIFAMGKAVNGLTKAQIEIGLNSMFEQGYCPDPVMFRKWCLGITGFTESVDPVKDSYKGKYAAIANIEAWLSDPSTSITNAERGAYNRVYGMFNQLKYANNYEKQKFYAYEAFKDAYVDVVKELIEQGVKQERWVDLVALNKPKKKKEPELTPEQKEENLRIAIEFREKMRELIKR